MKNYLFIAILGASCCSCYHPVHHSSNYFVSANAHSLIDTYRNIVSETNTNLCPYPGDSAVANRRCNYSAMPLNGIKGSKGEGYISFLSYNNFEYRFIFEITRSIKPSIVSFRTIWMADADIPRLPICENCYPKPIVLPIGLIDHKFETVLVPVDSYQSSGIMDTDYIGDSRVVSPNSILDLAINSTEIRAINDVFMEKDGGFSSTKFPIKYNSEYSSVGLICEVILKNNTKLDCYIFNNEDLISNRFRWKVKK
jgi:hypothetical protein